MLTNLREGPRVLMYRGTLRDFYFRPDGQISYIVLVSCVRYYMTLDEDGATTTEPIAIGSRQGAQEGTPVSNLVFMIEGEDIANLVYETFPLTLTGRGEEALTRALRDTAFEHAAQVAADLGDALTRNLPAEVGAPLVGSAWDALHLLDLYKPTGPAAPRAQEFLDARAALERLIERARDRGWVVPTPPPKRSLPPNPPRSRGPRR